MGQGNAAQMGCRTGCVIVIEDDRFHSKPSCRTKRSSRTRAVTATQPVSPRVRKRSFAARQPHRKDRLSIVRARFCGPRMGLCNLADDLQAAAGPRVSPVGRATFQRFNKLQQRRRVDSGTAVAHLDANVSLTTDHRYAHRCVR